MSNSAPFSIPASLMDAPHIGFLEAGFLSEIARLSKRRPCTASNEFFRVRFKLPDTSTKPTRIIGSLAKAGLIEVVNPNSRRLLNLTEAGTALIGGDKKVDAVREPSQEPAPAPTPEPMAPKEEKPSKPKKSRKKKEPVDPDAPKPPKPAIVAMGLPLWREDFKDMWVKWCRHWVQQRPNLPLTVFEQNLKRLEEFDKELDVFALTQSCIDLNYYTIKPDWTFRKKVDRRAEAAANPMSQFKGTFV